MIRLFFLITFLAHPAFATDACDDLWLTRNLIFDRAGYCFGSVLGQTVFDNADCTTKSPTLSPAQNTTIARIRELEGWIGCSVNTKSRHLNVDALELRLRLSTLPVRDRLESGCIGWRGEPVVLFDGIQADAQPIAQIQRGDTILFSHEFMAPFSFVSIIRKGAFAGLGWTNFSTNDQSCDQWAG